jgi:PPK2 family polyphosphate:nucleotide phosphotransferase
MAIQTKRFVAKPGKRIDLDEWPTLADPVYRSKKRYHALLDQHVAALSDLQQLLYAADSHALLLIFQAMDAAGKDGAIKHVMSGVNPQGCQVTSFKHPSAQELQHDFLWRTTRDLPERGRIGIFNRSYYEEVLITRVHPEILVGEGVPEQDQASEAIWKERYRSIVGLERHLHANGTRIVKIFLHLSKEEQRRRFLKRIDDPKRNWKFSMADVEERKFWDAYLAAYGACLSATSTRDAPWHIVPADDKLNARLIVSQIVLEALDGMKLKWPESGPDRARELSAVREELLK